jgi:hypothetical protein
MADIGFSKDQKEYTNLQKVVIKDAKHNSGEETTNKLTQATYRIPDVIDIKRCTLKYDDIKAYSIIAGADVNGTNTSYWVLPMPLNLDYNSSYNWSEEDLDHGAAAVAGMGHVVSNLLNGNFSEAGTAFYNSLGGGVADAIPTWAMRGAIQKATDAMNVNGGQVLKEVERQRGISYNPNKQLYFDGVNMRDFNVRFSLAPTSQKEAENIQKGFSELAYRAAPSYSQEQFYFTYPDFFKFTVVVVDGNGNHHIMLSRAGLAITELSLDLAPDDALTWHSDGFPTALELSVAFKESVVPTKDNLSKITLFGKKLGG